MTTFSATTPIPTGMQSIITNCAAGLGGVGIMGGIAGPGSDLALIIPTWVGMTIALAQEANLPMDDQAGHKIAAACATAVGGIIAGTKAANTVLGWLAAKFTLGASLLASAGANAALNYAYTQAYGRAVARYFTQTERLHSPHVIAAVIIGLIAADLGVHIPGGQLSV